MTRKIGETRRPGASRGFTLLEILVSLAILGLGLSVVSSLTTETMKRSERVEEDTAAQAACQNLMNAILAGDATVSIGTPIPVSGANDWAAIVELLDGPLDNLVAIRITAQKYETLQAPSQRVRGAILQSRVPVSGRVFVLKEWARRADVKTRTIKTNPDGSLVAVEGTAADVVSSTSATGAPGTGGVGGSNENGELGSDLTGGLTGGQVGAPGAIGSSNASNASSAFGAVDAAFGGLGAGAVGDDASGLGGGLGVGVPGNVGATGGFGGGVPGNDGFGGGF